MTTYTSGLISAVEAIIDHWQQELEALAAGEARWTGETWASFSDDLQHARLLILPLRGRLQIPDVARPERAPDG